MTDEERALEIAARYGDTWPPERKMALTLAIVDALTSTRADEREKCAKLVDDHDEGFKVSSGERFLTARSDGNRSGLAYAAAIRAMGDRG